MSVILALETSTQACSCALNMDGRIAESFDIIPRQHASKLLPMIEALLSRNSLAFADLDAVAYGQGPGSFTGLRIAAGVTQGIAFGAGIPVIPVSSLASLAMQVIDDEDTDLVFSCLDARIDEVYWGFYRVAEGSVELLGSEGLCKPERLPSDIPIGSTVAVGSGLDYLDRMPERYRELFAVSRADLYPRAGKIAELAAGYFSKGLTQGPEAVSPVYLRDKVTHS